MEIYDGLVDKSMALRLVTDGIGLYGANLRMDFTFEEVQRYLLNRGYKFCIVEGSTKVQDTKLEDNEVHYIGKPYNREFTIFMVFNPFLIKDGKVILDLQDPQVQAMQIDVVFRKELKKQLLGF